MKLNDFIDSKFDQIGLTKAQKFCVGAHILVRFGAALGRRPYLNLEDKTYANLCAILVGPTGSGKGVSYRFVQNLLNGLCEDLLAPQTTATNAGSMKQLLKEINSILSESFRKDKGDLRIEHINEEFSGELRAAGSVYQSKLPDVICKLVDGSPISETFGKQSIDFPYLYYSLMGHITQKELKNSMREHLITGGTVNRLLWLMVPHDMSTPLPAVQEDIRIAIREEIAESLRFAFELRSIEIDEEAIQLIKKFDDEIKKERAKNDSIWGDLIARFTLHVKKLTLIFGMLRRVNVIDPPIVQDAIDLVNGTRGILKTMLPNSQETIEHAILNYLHVHGPTKPSTIYKEFLERFKIHKMRIAINELVKSGLAKRKRIDNGNGLSPECLTTD